MTFLMQTIQAKEIKRFDNPPDGDYNVAVESESVRTDKNGVAFVALTLTILDGEYQGRKIFHNLASTQLPENKDLSLGQRGDIADEQLAAIAHYCGIPQLNDVAELIGRPFGITTKTKGDYYNVQSIGTTTSAANVATPPTLADQQVAHAERTQPKPFAAPGKPPGIMGQ